ncbi:unnamed protein product [Polarella glacialis]|uniref:Uncharacterized protein n=1 Tax=Polarella glacialis TaxID=89957 RepID=A0A813LDE0_POLGL|nr:unnamed protein product [Polarella glacialis]CAE8629894.1 unnamed protein product [Polarella glacialis]CAE8730313.1 unnamed protein product [Polarella glacialis]
MLLLALRASLPDELLPQAAPLIAAVACRTIPVLVFLCLLRTCAETQAKQAIQEATEANKLSRKQQAAVPGYHRIAHLSKPAPKKHRIVAAAVGGGEVAVVYGPFKGTQDHREPLE